MEIPESTSDYDQKVRENTFNVGVKCLKYLEGSKICTEDADLKIETIEIIQYGIVLRKEEIVCPSCGKRRRRFVLNITD